MSKSVCLYVNVDHVATLRQTRGTSYPDPAMAADQCEAAGADGITVHLREDRRHIQDRDVKAIRVTRKTSLNLEMAMTEEMILIACQVHPRKVTLVPENRQERTTEGGLNVRKQLSSIQAAVRRLNAEGIDVSLFVDPEPDVVTASVETGAQEIELHTGDFASACLLDDDVQSRAKVDGELARLTQATDVARQHHHHLRLAAGHGLALRSTEILVRHVPSVRELNIGHALIADAIFCGLGASVRRYAQAIQQGIDARQ